MLFLGKKRNTYTFTLPSAGLAKHLKQNKAQSHSVLRCSYNVDMEKQWQEIDEFSFLFCCCCFLRLSQQLSWHSVCFKVKADSPHWWAETTTPVWRWWPADFCWQPVGSVCCSAPDPTGSSPDAPLHSRPGCLRITQQNTTQHTRCKCDKCFVQKCTIALLIVGGS